VKKNILITGSTDGIGKLAAIRLAKDGHQIYLHGRNEEKLEKVVQEIRQYSRNQEIKGFTADFSNLSAVEGMAVEVLESVPSLDVLVNNAGVFKSPVDQVEGGYDIRLVVNYLAPHLLTHQLITLLQKSKTPQIINLSSAAQAPVSTAFLKGGTQIGTQAAYAQSKLAITMWSFHLAKQYPEICTIALNPGSLLNTNMVREAYGKFWSPAEKGGDIIYDLVSKEEHLNDSGKYYDNDSGRFTQAHGDAYNENKIKELLSMTPGC